MWSARALLAIVTLEACGSHGEDTVEIDAPAATPDAAAPDAPSGVPLAGFGALTGMCGVLAAADMTSATPELVRATIAFDRAYVDPDDRPLLTPGGLHLAETPNAGGSSGLSEIFAFEQLDRCELAQLLKTETEIVYSTTGKITDLEVMLDGHKIGVSVTRAVTFPFGGTYTLTTATTLMTKKLTDIQASSANVSAQDKWDKQILAVLAWDDTVADTIAQAWAGLSAGVKADTIVVVTTTSGDDTFIYSNN